MSSAPTLFYVHAHPDDEAFFGAGAAARYAARGHRVVLVTCTYGQLGYDPEGRSGLDDGHDAAETQRVRAGELQRAAAMLGFSRVVTLGYGDSGREGWPGNDAPSAFVKADVDAVARTLAALMDEEDARVVVTYDENGFYGHPDHVQAHRVTRAAIELATSVERLYYPVVPSGVIEDFVARAQSLGADLPAWVLRASTSDDLVTNELDVRDVAGLKQRAMAAHESQIDNADLIGLREDVFTLFFGTEYYQRAWSRHDVRGDETDLFGGLSWD